MKDFAVILRSADGQVFGVSGEYILKKEKPAAGCTNRWLFELPNGQVLEVIIVAAEKAKLAVLVGHYAEVGKALLRRLGNSLARI